MAQKNKAMNFLIHDAHGQPQMVKVLHSQSTKPSSNQIQLSPKFKDFFKVPGAPDSLAGNATVYRTLNVTGLKPVSKLVHVPMQQHLQKVNVGNTAPGQSLGTVKKIQMQSVTTVQKVMTTVPKLVQAVPKLVTQVTSEVDSKSHISPILTHNSRKRHDSESDSLTEYTSKRRRAAEKVGKGLRHFSMKVCEKVRRKGFTSYNEVADELVTEFAAGIHSSPDNQQYDQKNIRRRVYDALNVLMAMNIISKEKKEIRWLGLPTNSIQECSSLEKEKKIKLDRIQQKTQQLHDLILQIISFKSLVERNKLAESKGSTPSASSAIQLPFIVVNTSDQALIDCSISNDKMEYMFQFNERFQIHDDIEILKRMGLLYGLEKGECSEADIQRAKNMVPKSLEHYIDQIGRGVNIQMEDLKNVTIKTEAEIDESNLDEEEEGEVDADGDGFGTNSNYSDEDDDDEDQDSSSDVEVN